MDASIIILTKNSRKNFFTLLRQLSHQKFDDNYEVIVIDSGSTDGTSEIAQSFPVKMVRINPEEFHHGKTRNLGAGLSSGRILVYITQDAKPPEKFFYNYYFPEHRIEVVRNASDYYRDNMFISNVNSAIRREVWQSFKFSEDVALGEDKELAKRVLLAGWKIIYRPDAAVYHSHDFHLWSIFRRCIDTGMALSQGINVPRSKNWVIQRLGYFVREVGYIVTNKGWLKWLPYSVAYETVKVSGTALGWINGKFL